MNWERDWLGFVLWALVAHAAVGFIWVGLLAVAARIWDWDR